MIFPNLDFAWFCMFFWIFKTPFLRPIAISTPTAVPSPFVAVLATWRRRAFQVQQPKTCWLTKYKLQVRNKLVDFIMPISLSYYVNPTYEIGQICLQSAVFPAFSSVYEVTTGRDQFFFQIWVLVLSIPLPIGSMYAIYGNIYHKYTPVMLAYIAAPWIRHGLWHISTWWAFLLLPQLRPLLSPSHSDSIHSVPRDSQACIMDHEPLAPRRENSGSPRIVWYSMYHPLSGPQNRRNTISSGKLT